MICISWFTLLLPVMVTDGPGHGWDPGTPGRSSVRVAGAQPLHHLLPPAVCPGRKPEESPGTPVWDADVPVQATAKQLPGDVGLGTDNESLIFLLTFMVRQSVTLRSHSLLIP